jgi:transmembrane sensor
MTVRESKLESGPIDEQAAHWLAALKDNPTPDCHAAFTRWLNESPAHAHEFALAQEVEDRLQRFHRQRRVDLEALIERARQEQRAERRRSWITRIAASVALLAFLSSGVVFLHDTAENYVTEDSQRLIELDDGSVVAMNRDTRLRVSFSDATRDLHLERGQAIFKVRRDPRRPFRVHAGNTVVEAVGTQFDVRVGADRTTVAVIEGVVQLKPVSVAERAIEHELLALEIPRITAGQLVSISNEARHAGRVEQVRAIDPTAIAAWRQPAEQLQFKNEPLGEIANELNRHNAAPKLRIEGDALRERRFILVLRNSSPQSLLNYLALDPRLEFVHDGDDIVIRERAR